MDYSIWRCPDKCLKNGNSVNTEDLVKKTCIKKWERTEDLQFWHFLMWFLKWRVLHLGSRQHHRHETFIYWWQWNWNQNNNPWNDSIYHHPRKQSLNKQFLLKNLAFCVLEQTAVLLVNFLPQGDTIYFMIYFNTLKSYSVQSKTKGIACWAKDWFTL